MKFLLTSILLFLTVTFAASGAPIEAADSAKVYFRVGHRQFDPSFEDNRAVMDHFVAHIRQAAAAGTIDSIVVRGYASPDGSENYNRRLAASRARTIIEILKDRTGVSSELFHTAPGGIAWDELRRLIVSAPDVPEREKILDILDNTPIWVFNAQDKIVDSRKKQLMDLRGGRPYNWMLSHIFPQLRNTVAVMLYIAEPDDNIVDEEPSETAIEETATEQEAIATPPLPLPEAVTDFTVIEENNAAESTVENWIESEVTRRLVIKTNLLYDAALLPNLELEWMATPRWSVALEGNVAWWSNAKKFKYYQLAMVSPEVRYWLKTRDMWHGLFAGAFVGGGLYDLQNGGTGYRGEGGMAGLSVGYMWPLSRHLSMEASIGAGYMRTRYKMYVPRDGHSVYLRTKDLNYFGPLKLKLSLVWKFTTKHKTLQNNSVI